jgi:hypothetical protein
MGEAKPLLLTTNCQELRTRIHPSPLARRSWLAVLWERFWPRRFSFAFSCSSSFSRRAWSTCPAVSQSVDGCEKPQALKAYGVS